MKKIIVAFCSTLMLVGPICHADVASNASAFVSQLLPRIMKIEKMPTGEPKAANVVLLASDLFAYVSQLGTQVQQTISSLPSQMVAITEAQSVYDEYHSWNNPAAQVKLAELEAAIVQYQSTLTAASTASATEQKKFQALSTALTTAGTKIQQKYGSRPIGPVAQNVFALGQNMSASFSAFATLWGNYSTKMQAYITCMQNNTNPGQLPTQLVLLEAQLQSFQPVGGHSFAQMAQLFKGYSQQIRTMYPGMN